jgi:prepilin-type N-terminal cleavage/methylation domain-containing protein
MKTKSSRYGFTLTEVVISMGLLSLLTLVLYATLDSTVKAWHLSDTRVDLEQNLRIGLDWMVMEMREATSYSSDQPVITPSNSQATSSYMVFTKPISSFDPNNPSVQTTKYSVDGNNNLVRTVNGTDAQIIANNVTDIKISHYLDDTTDVYQYPNNVYSTRLYQVSISCNTTINGETYHLSLESDVRLRSP